MLSQPQQVFSVRGFEALFPPLGPWIMQSVSLLSCSSRFIHTKCGTACSTSYVLTHLVLQPLPCLESSPPWLSVSAPPTGLNECFFFNSLVVGLPYSSIFWQFWLFFVFKFVVLLWLCEETQCIYLHLYFGQKPPKPPILFLCH